MDICLSLHFCKRLIIRWRVPILLLCLTVLFWSTFILKDKSIPVLHKVATSTILPNLEKPDSKPSSESPLSSKNVKYWLKANDNFAIQSPNIRRLPLPVVYELAKDVKPNDDENAAREEDVVRESESVKVDENAAREEHSGEVQFPTRVKNSRLNAKIGHLKKNEKSESEVEVPVIKDFKAAQEFAEQEASFHQLPEHQKDPPEDKYGPYNNWRNLSLTKISRLSVLGRRLFLNEKIGHEKDRMFKIHVWKYFPHLEKRHFYRYGTNLIDPLEGCSVSNCKITSADEDVLDADAVLFHLHRIDAPPTTVPRRHDQLWVWLSDESPFNTFMVSKDKVLSHYTGIFNWSMTYRMDSDVPVPYGRTVPLPKDQYKDKIDTFVNTKPKDVAVLISNCGGRNYRYKYIRELERFIPVDVYGGCGSLKCPGHFNKDCPKLNDYKFYLAFENSNCEDYITEKVWWNALQKGAIPIVMGSSKESYRRTLPPDSFIYADDFESPKVLAQYLVYLLENSHLFEEYHSWRRKYQILNEHGYFQTPVYHFCRLCEALNYNDRPKGGETADLERYFDPVFKCYPARWKPV